MAGLMRVRSVVLLLVVVSLTSFAAGPKKPASLLGSAKEDECPLPVVSHQATADVAYLRALAWAFEPAPQEIRAQAIEDLGFLGDTRALNALAVMTLDANAVISKAAIRAVGTMRSPRAEEILGNLVRHPTVSPANRLLALSLMPFQNTPTALRFVHIAARQLGVTPEIGQAARGMAASLPNPSPDEAVPPIPDVQVAPPGALAPSPFPLGDTK
ncbi:MAG: HEAT repeat domain-containing protein [Myxococcaceae bacterium]